MEIFCNCKTDMRLYPEISDRINDQNFGHKIEQTTNCAVILATEFATELFGRNSVANF